MFHTKTKQRFKLKVTPYYVLSLFCLIGYVSLAQNVQAFVADKLSQSSQITHLAGATIKAEDTAKKWGKLTETDLLATYPWLTSIINPETCSQGDEVKLYAPGVFEYIIVKINGVRTMYNGEGTRYCTDRKNFSCAKVYWLGNPIITWTCNNQPPVGENCLVEDPFSLSFVQDAMAAGIAQQGCTSPFKITQIDYNGSSYFKTELGPSANAPTNSPCGVTEYYGDTRDCEGNIICWVALALPPPNYNQEVCNAISNGQGTQTIIWKFEEDVQPFPPIFDHYPWLSSIVDMANCNEYTSIKEYDLGSFTYIYIETPLGGVLYFEDGTKYCTSSSTRDCEMLYALTTPTSTYNCDGSVTADYTFTICSGESVTLVPEYNIATVSCVCPPCPPVGPLGPPPVEWNPIPAVCSTNPTCFSPMVSPTETTFYTAVAEGQLLGSPGCGPIGPQPASKETTFLVIVSDEGCEQNACEYDDPLTDLPWLADLANQDVPQKISTHNYNSETVFLVSIELIDAGYEIYNCEGEIICSVQIFDTMNNCPDFNYTDTFIEFIFDNTCNAQNPLQLPWVLGIINQQPANDCATHSINMFEYAGRKHFILKPSAACTLATPGGGFTILNCDEEIVCTTIANVTCNDAIIEASQNAVEIWAYDESVAAQYDQIYTICPGESITLEAEYSLRYISCQCPPCGPVGAPGEPRVDWFPLSSGCNSCLSLTISPTETTVYTSDAEGVVYGNSGCGGPSGAGAPATLTTFLVIVSDEGCGNSKTASSKEANLKMLPKINVYPNPTSHFITIDLPHIVDTQSTLTLKNIGGQTLQNLQLYPSPLNKQQIDLSDYLTGIYLLEYFNGETITVEKIIKK